MFFSHLQEQFAHNAKINSPPSAHNAKTKCRSCAHNAKTNCRTCAHNAKINRGGNTHQVRFGNGRLTRVDGGSFRRIAAHRRSPPRHVCTHMTGTAAKSADCKRVFTKCKDKSAEIFRNAKTKCRTSATNAKITRGACLALVSTSQHACFKRLSIKSVKIRSGTADFYTF